MVKLSGRSGTLIKIVTGKIKKDGVKASSVKLKRGRIKNSYTSGSLTANDWNTIFIGLRMLEKVISDGFTAQEKKLLLGENDVSRIKKEIVGFQEIIQDFIARLEFGAINEYDIKNSIETVLDDYQIIQAARDGIILKQEKRTEIVNGVEKEIIYDTSMTSREVESILNEYDKQLKKVKFERINNYLGLGLGIAGTLGTIIKSNRKEYRGSVSLVTISTLVIAGLRLLEETIFGKHIEEIRQIRNEGNGIKNDFLENEQISVKAEGSAIVNIKEIREREKKLENKLENSRLIYNVILDLLIATLSGAYINRRITTKENGKIDGKSLALAISDFQGISGIAKHFLDVIQGIVNGKKKEEEFVDICKKLQEILNQMEEKIYPLNGAKCSFDSVLIQNFTGKFYPKKNYETGEIDFETIIQIPEFSMKRGDVVLLSGESGAGKSTFLRFLKRGDINNRQAIQIDNDEMVDNLGEEYLAFRPSINLGDETNGLYQITGKKNISDLSIEEQERLEGLLRELKFDDPNLLQKLSTKKFMEFSTGQQRRLALSKVFYRINDGTSVIIVDEPVGNVEDTLIREQLGMIRKYAEKRNVMLILTTHRIDLAEDLVNKRYHISREGIMEQIPIKNKTTDERID